MTGNKLLELTLAILKPHIMKNPISLREIHKIIISNKFYIIESKIEHLSVEKAKHFYQEHEEKFFFNRLVTFMSSGESEFLILAKNNAILDWRELMGPTKVYKTQFSHPDSIRARFGLSDTRNATHGSDSQESAAKEISIFFPNFNMEDWFTKEEIFFRNGKVQFQEELFKHIPIK